MKKIITPQKCLELVLNKKPKPIKVGLPESKWQNIWLFLSASFLIIGSILGVISRFSESKTEYLFAITLLVLSTLFFLFLQIALMFSMFKELKNSEKAISQPLIDNFNKDIDIIAELSRDFEEHHLTYAKESFQQLSSHLKTRIALLVGAIEKTGIIPLALTTYFAISKAINDSIVVFSEIEAILIGLILLYLFAFYMVNVTQKLDRISLIFEQAINKKGKQDN